MYEHETVTLTWYALALAAVYLAISSQFKRRVGSQPEVVKVINLLHIAIAIAFITIAIPLKLDAHWITIGWLIESAVLLFVAVKTQTSFLRYFAGVTLTLGIFRLLIVDNFQTNTLIFNARFATYLVAIAIMAGIVAAGERYASAREKPFVKMAGVALNLLALLALTLEARDYFSHQITLRYEQTQDYTTSRQLQVAQDFSYSAIWLLYGAGLMAVGFWKRLGFLRWQALASLPTDSRLRLVAVYGLSRAQMVLLAATSPPAGDGLGAAFISTLPRRTALWVAIESVALAALAGWPTGLALLAANAAMLLLVRRWFALRLGGVTGDCLGFLCVASEALSLVVLAWA